MFDFIKTLLPRLDRDDVLNDLKITSKELTDTNMPAYNSAVTLFNVNKLTSDKNRDISNVFFRTHSTGKGKSVIHEVNSKLPNVKKNLDYLEKEIKVLFSRDILSEGLTAKKAILLRSAELMSFVTRYASDLLTLIYVNEGKKIGEKIETEVDGLLPITEAKITKNIASFTRALEQCGMKHEDYVALMGKIPDVYVSSNSEGVLSSIYGFFSLDPFLLKNNVLSFDGNPIYHIGLMVVEWQTNRIKRDIELRNGLELRRMHLEALYNETADPGIEKQINVIQERIEDLDFKIKKFEESAGIKHE